MTCWVRNFFSPPFPFDGPFVFSFHPFDPRLALLHLPDSPEALQTARLDAEALGNVSIRVLSADRSDTWTVQGRGELQLGVEAMRRAVAALRGLMADVGVGEVRG